MLNRNYYFYLFAIAFICGATVVQLFYKLSNVSLLMTIVAVISICFFRRAYFFVPIVGFCIGFNWVAWFVLQQLSHSFPAHLEKQLVEVKGQVFGLPKYKRGNIQFDFHVDELRYQHQVELKDIKVRLNCYRCPLQIKPAQYWQFTVKLKKPHGFASWGASDYEKYLFRHVVSARGYIRDSDLNKVIKSIDRTYYLQKIHIVRYKLANYIEGLLAPVPNAASTINALLLGDKSLMSKQQYETLQSTGLNHLFAISGMHIGLMFLVIRLLSGFLLKPCSVLFLYLPRQHIQNILGLVFAAFYAALAGFAIPTQRALIMLSVYVLLRLSNRQASLFQVLLIAAVAIILLDPNALMDMGFGMSFSAVFVICLSMKNIGKTSLLSLQPRLWLGMLPLLLLFFQSASLIAPVLNLIVIPIFTFLLIPVLMFALLSLVAGFHQFANLLFIKIADLLEYGWLGLFKVAKFSFAEFEYQVTPISLCFITLIIMVFLQPNKLPARYSLLFLLPVALFGPAKQVDSQFFSITMLDVGQGLSMVVQTKNYTLVYDTGAKFSDDFIAADIVLIPYLRYAGVRDLDMLIVSHADNDHIGGYNSLIRHYLPEKTLTSRTDKVEQSKQCRTGQVWKFDDVSFEIISPEPATPIGSNNRSCVLKIYSDYGSALLTGDIEKSTERYLLSKHKNKLQSQLLLVPHQGSKTSSTDAFIEAVNPQQAIVSAGYLNQYGHPNKKIMQRYKKRNIPVLSNIESGSIRISFTKNGRLIEQYRKLNKRFWRIK